MGATACHHGKDLRKKVPRESHAEWIPSRNRPDPLETNSLPRTTKADKRTSFRCAWDRMAASPFTFLRGSACVMAADLSDVTNAGIPVIIDGDAHLNNFGFYGTPQRGSLYSTWPILTR